MLPHVITPGARSPHLKLLQLWSDQTLSFGQRSVTPLDALMHLRHGVRGATTTLGAAAEHATLRWRAHRWDTMLLLLLLQRSAPQAHLCCTYLHFTYVVPLQTLDHFFHHGLHACLMCLCHLWAPDQVFANIRDDFRVLNLTGSVVSAVSTANCSLSYFIKAKVTSIQAWSKRGMKITPLPLYFRSRFNSVNSSSVLCVRASKLTPRGVETNGLTYLVEFLFYCSPKSNIVNNIYF